MTERPRQAQQTYSDEEIRQMKEAEQEGQEG